MCLFLSFFSYIHKSTSAAAADRGRGRGRGRDRGRGRGRSSGRGRGRWQGPDRLVGGCSGLGKQARKVSAVRLFVCLFIYIFIYLFIYSPGARRSVRILTHFPPRHSLTTPPHPPPPQVSPCRSIPKLWPTDGTADGPPRGINDSEWDFQGKTDGMPRKPSSGIRTISGPAWGPSLRKIRNLNRRLQLLKRTVPAWTAVFSNTVILNPPWSSPSLRFPCAIPRPNPSLPLPPYLTSRISAACNALHNVQETRGDGSQCKHHATN